MPTRGAVTTSASLSGGTTEIRGPPTRAPSRSGPTAERLPEPARAAAQQEIAHAASPLAHQLEADRRLERAHEHGGGRPGPGAAYQVQHPVDPVAAVDVDAAGRSEHRGVAPRRTREAVRRGVVLLVGLDLDDQAADPVDRQQRTDDLARDDVHVACEERIAHIEASTSASVCTTCSWSRGSSRVWNGSASVRRAACSATGHSPSPCPSARKYGCRCTDGQVRLARDAAVAQLRHHQVAVDLRIELARRTRTTSARRRSRPGVGRPTPGDVGEQLAVARRDGRALREDLVDSLELRHADRGRHLVEAVVVAEPVVLEPLAVVRATLVRERLQARLQVDVVGRDHAALARGDLLVRVEGEDREVPVRADASARGDRPDGLGGILDHREPVPPRDLVDAVDRARVAEDVHREDRPRPRT